MRWKPHVTVAAVIEKNNRFLVVEEDADGHIVINQPAGHLENGETLIAAVKREVLEETAWEFEPERVTGIYLYPSPQNNITYLRFCFSGCCLQHQPQQDLDKGILQAIWMTRDELLSQAGKLRSPLVLRCIDDYLGGRQFPLEMLHYYTQGADRY